MEPHALYRRLFELLFTLRFLHKTSPNFAELEKRLEPHVKRLLKKLNWDLQGRKVKMTTCWANSMGKGTYHTLHVHPSSVLSGVYYVDVPKGSSPLKIEDPRMGLLMACPPRKRSAPRSEQNYLSIDPVAGDFLLFESWLRHEVAAAQGAKAQAKRQFQLRVDLEAAARPVNACLSGPQRL